MSRIHPLASPCTVIDLLRIYTQPSYKSCVCVLKKIVCCHALKIVSDELIQMCVRDDYTKHHIYAPLTILEIIMRHVCHTKHPFILKVLNQFFFWSQTKKNSQKNYFFLWSHHSSKKKCTRPVFPANIFSCGYFNSAFFFLL